MFFRHVLLLHPSLPQARILVQQHHLLDDLVIVSVEMVVVILVVDPRVVPSLLPDPLFLLLQQISLELAFVVANNPFRWIKVAITDIVGTLRDVLWPLDVVADKSFAIWPQPLQLLSVEAPVLDGAVVPGGVFELQIVVEEVLTFDELTAVPFGNISTLYSLINSSSKLTPFG